VASNLVYYYWLSDLFINLSNGNFMNDLSLFGNPIVYLKSTLIRED